MTAGLIRRARERVELRLEQRGILDSCRRLILVSGMARTGTSATAAYIGSHPSVRLVVGDGMWSFAESDLARQEKGDVCWDTIEELLREHFPNRILIKQPWASANMSFLWMVLRRGGKIIICFREKRSLLDSWNKSPHVSSSTKLYPEKTYNDWLKCDERVIQMGAMRVDMEKLGPDMAVPLGKHLRLDPNGFDPERIKKRWEEILEEPWVKKHAIWKDRPR